MADNRKGQRTSAKGRLTRYVNSLNTLLDEKGNNLNEAILLFDDVLKAWDNVEIKHADYTASLDETADTAVEDAWIADEQAKFDTVRKKFTNYKDSINETESINVVTCDRAIYQKLFEEQCKSIDEAIKSSCSVDTILREKRAIQKRLDDLEVAHKKVVLMDPSLDAAWIFPFCTKFNTTNSNIDEYIAAEKLKKERKLENGNFKLEKLPLPTFDGKIRSYARFRNDFKELVEPNLSAHKAAYALRKALPSHVSEYLGSCEDNLVKMFQRLDIKYADPSKIVESIVSEIQQFKKFESEDTMRLIKFVDALESGYRDLKSINLQHELANANVVSIVESKLPGALQLDWYRHIHKKDSSVNMKNKFPDLLEFLRVERNALEYATSDMRSNSRFSVKHGNINVIDQTSECLIHKPSNHTTENCRTFEHMKTDERYALLKENSACFSCLQRSHMVQNCPQKVTCGVDNCNKSHHKSLHYESGVVVPTDGRVTTVSENTENNHVILPVMKVRVGSRKEKYVNVLWDSAASVSLITNKMASKLKSKGVPVQLLVTVAGGEEKLLDTHRYLISLLGSNGRLFALYVYGIDKISNEISKIQVHKITCLFVADELPPPDILRPTGEIDILVGYNYAAWHPTKIHENGHLVILCNQFGTCLGGSHPSINEHTKKCINKAEVVNLIQGSNPCEDFNLSEGLGVQCVPRCGGCKCGLCPIGSKQYTLREERELNLISNNLSFTDTQWVIKYPWIKDPALLPNNYISALKVLEKTEKRLAQNSAARDAYAAQIQDLFDRKVARQISDSELAAHKGPFHYIAHQIVYKPDSDSSPARVVFNSSSNYKGHVLNDYWAKGPDAFLNNLFGILLRFREGYVGYVGDIKKMYHSIMMSPEDQHCHRFLWRTDTNKAPSINCMTALNMGDRPSGTIATVALRKTAEMSEEQFPVESAVIIDSSYMDDIVDSVDSVENALSATKNISNILKKGNFSIKHWTISSDPVICNILNDAHLEMDDTLKVLGVYWNHNSDVLWFHCRLNFSNFINGSHSEPDLNIDDIPHKIPLHLNMRHFASALNGIFDPAGLLTPFTVKGKIIMRKLWMLRCGWDDPLPQDNREECIQFFRELLIAQTIKFPRCMKPKNAIGDPILVLFSDGSLEAYGCCAYSVWKIKDGTQKAMLMASKGRIAPVKTISIVRLELSAAVLAKRLRSSIMQFSRWKFAKVVHIIDSEIVRSMIAKDSYGFRTFVATRVGEIQSETVSSEWHWIEGKLNIADMVTRGVHPHQLDLGSEWQCAPSFLTSPIEDWPIRQDVVTEDLPEKMGIVLALNDTSVTAATPIDINRYSNFMRLIRVTARILCLKLDEKEIQNVPKYTFKCLREVKLDKMKSAIEYWIKLSQCYMRVDLEKATKGKGPHRKLNIIKNDKGIYVARGRISEWNQMSESNAELPVLHKNNRFSELFVRYTHRQNHLGVNTEAAKISIKYWIIGVQKLVKSVRIACVWCRRHYNDLESQVMGQLPVERLKPAPPWSYIGIDLFGPIAIRGEVNKRSTGKGYGVILTCFLTRAVHLDLAADYSTDAFLMTFRRFVSIRGNPKRVYSDPGSQLVAASKELTDMFSNLQWDKIHDFSTNNGFEWKFSPADAPWYNGCCESLIRSVKKSLHIVIGFQRVTYNELQTILFECANLVNDRPIGKVPNSMEEGSYLCPNDMLLGRSSIRVPGGDFDATINSKRRLYFVQRVVDSFWRKWTVFYFPSLLTRKKWHTESRNVAVDDLVIIKDKDLPRGKWKLGLVSNVYTDKDNKVRRVTIAYKNVNSNVYTEVERAVQNLVVISTAEELKE